MYAQYTLQNLKSVFKFKNTFAYISSYVRTDFKGHICTIGINRPEKRNCVNHETALLLRKAFENFAAQDSAYVAVLYGVGGTFCSGYDLQEVSQGIPQDMKMDDGPMGPSKMVLDKPVIAAISGFAVAGGMELALWADLRVMEETATMGFLNRRFGVPLIDGGTVRLPKLIGLSRALELILTGRKIDAREAYEIGLVTRLCKEGEAYNKAMELAEELCQYPQHEVKAQTLHKS